MAETPASMTRVVLAFLLAFDEWRVSTAIAEMMRTGTTGRQLITAITTAFPDLSATELSQALQVAQAQAERKALRPH